MLHDLMELVVNEKALRHPLKTEAKRELTARSLEPVARWWFEKLRTGCLIETEQEEEADDGDGENWPPVIFKSALHEDYINFLNRHYRGGRETRATQTELGQFLHKNTPLTQQRKLFGTNRERCWNIPELEECRAAWVIACDWPKGYSWED